VTARQVDPTDLAIGDLGYFGESPCAWKVTGWQAPNRPEQFSNLQLRHENGTSTKVITSEEAMDQNWLWWREEALR
jgi:hypothetical protein